MMKYNLFKNSEEYEMSSFNNVYWPVSTFTKKLKDKNSLDQDPQKTRTNP